MIAEPDYFYGALSQAYRPTRITSSIQFARDFVKLPGSARSESFDDSITPWTREPIEDLDDPFFRHGTFVKPIQSGGSVVGEVAVCKWVAGESGGDVQYNWQDDENADARWDKRIERILLACGPVAGRWPSIRGKVQKGLVLFPHLNLMVQGVFTEKRVASDSIRFQVNEEIHSWKPGRLVQAHGRTTAYWNSIILEISNASVKGDQLHQVFEAGTQQHWEVKCPGCGLYHRMRTRWEDKRPDLGGLRYDAKNSRRTDGSYDYNRLESTIFFQMPCGYQVREDAKERRSLSLSGRYGEPDNKGAHTSHRSRTLEAVSVDYIPFRRLIEEKHLALKALKYGDAEPLKRYTQERECRFWDSEDRPIVERLVVNALIKKNREGLMKHPDFWARYFALDRQQGSLAKGEFPHWWLVMRDCLANGDSQLVFEGKILTDSDVIARLDEHKCVRRLGVADSGDDTLHVYRFCLQHGINAIKGDKQPLFAHEVPNPTESNETVREYRIYSEERFLWQMIPNGEPSRDNGDDEPRFWLYSKAGIRQRLDLLRTGKLVKWEVPEDVSEDYLKHMEGEDLVEETDKRGYTQTVYHAHTKRIDLRVCEAYIAMLMEMAGRIGFAAATAAVGETAGAIAKTDEKGSE